MSEVLRHMSNTLSLSLVTLGAESPCTSFVGRYNLGINSRVLGCPLGPCYQMPVVTVTDIVKCSWMIETAKSTPALYTTCLRGHMP